MKIYAMLVLYAIDRRVAELDRKHKEITAEDGKKRSEQAYKLAEYYRLPPWIRAFTPKPGGALSRYSHLFVSMQLKELRDEISSYRDLRRVAQHLVNNSSNEQMELPLSFSILLDYLPNKDA